MRWIKLFEGYFSDKRKEIEDKLKDANNLYDTSKRKLMDEIIEEVKDNLDFLLDEFTTGKVEYHENQISINDLTFDYSDIDKFCELEWKFVNLFDLDDFRLDRRISFKEKGSNMNVNFGFFSKDKSIDSKELKKAIDKYKYHPASPLGSGDLKKSTVLRYYCSIDLEYQNL